MVHQTDGYENWTRFSVCSDFARQMENYRAAFRVVRKPTRPNVMSALPLKADIPHYSKNVS